MACKWVPTTFGEILKENSKELRPNRPELNRNVPAPNFGTAFFFRSAEFPHAAPNSDMQRRIATPNFNMQRRISHTAPNSFLAPNRSAEPGLALHVQHAAPNLSADPDRAHTAPNFDAESTRTFGIYMVETHLESIAQLLDWSWCPCTTTCSAEF